MSERSYHGATSRSLSLEDFSKVVLLTDDVYTSA